MYGDTLVDVELREDHVKNFLNIQTAVHGRLSYREDVSAELSVRGTGRVLARVAKLGGF